jgi:hypothetical protein
MSGFIVLAILIIWATPSLISMYELEHRSRNNASVGVVIAMWCLLPVVVGLCALGAYVVYRDVRRRPSNILVFAGNPFTLFAEAFMSICGGLLLFLLAFAIINLPAMLDPAMERSEGPLSTFIPALLLAFFGILLIAWRPAYRIDPARKVLERFPIATWIPWSKKLPYEFTMSARVWTYMLGGRGQPIPVSVAIYAALPNSNEFVVDMLPLQSDPQTIESARRGWEYRLFNS